MVRGLARRNRLFRGLFITFFSTSRGALEGGSKLNRDGFRWTQGPVEIVEPKHQTLVEDGEIIVLTHVMTNFFNMRL